MSKAMLMIDMPENCEHCPFHSDEISGFYTRCKFSSQSVGRGKSIPKWCPLIPLDMKKMDTILRVVSDPNELYKIGL